MNEIAEKKQIAENTYSMKINAPEVAAKAKPGQFIALRVDEKAERIPLTIADFDKDTVTIVFLVVGQSTAKLAKLGKGDKIRDFLGPLGRQSHIDKFGTVVLVGGGLGIAPLYPQAKAFKKAGNKVAVVLGGRDKERIFWKEKFEKYADEVALCTDDGSCGIKGFVTDILEDRIDEADLVVAIGPTVMMKAVAEMTRGRVKTIVSLNPIMLDCVGMCGVCRVHVGKKVKFACVDGPEFDAHQVDFGELMARNRTYIEEERASLERFLHES